MSDDEELDRLIREGRPLPAEKWDALIPLVIARARRERTQMLRAVFGGLLRRLSRARRRVLSRTGGPRARRYVAP
jgi:hypothetical protein